MRCPDCQTEVSWCGPWVGRYEFSTCGCIEPLVLNGRLMQRRREWSRGRHSVWYSTVVFDDDGEGRQVENPDGSWGTYFTLDGDPRQPGAPAVVSW